MDGRVNYLSPETLKQNTTKSKILIGGGIAVGAFFALGLIGGLVGFNEELSKGIIVYIIIVVGAGYVVYRGISVHKMIVAAKRYNTILRTSRSEIVSMKDLAKQTQQTEDQVTEELEKLFAAGYFQSCMLQVLDNPGILIENTCSPDQVYQLKE